MNTDLDLLLREAAELGDEGAWDDAYRLLSGALDTAPDDAALLCSLGVAARHLGADGAAYEYFRRCVAQEPDDPVILVAAGSGLAMLDDPDAERVLRLAAVSAPRSAPARIAYGAYLAREGMTAAGLAELQAAVALGDEHGVEAHRELGLALLIAGETEDGLRMLQDAGEDGWTDPIRALAMLDAGHMHDAAELLYALAEAEPEDVELQILAALACAAEGWEEAAWNALARGELVATEEDRLLLAEAEERIETSPEAAQELLLEDLAPSVLRRRLLEPR